MWLKLGKLWSISSYFEVNKLSISDNEYKDYKQMLAQYRLYKWMEQFLIFPNTLDNFSLIKE